MENICRLFENMSEVVYATDMDTYEIIYMNKKALECYNLYSVEECNGRKCYEVLQGQSAPCAMCTNPRLREGEFVEWRYYNPTFCRMMELKDTMLVIDGRRIRLEIALNITSQEHGEGMLRRYRNSEMLANEAFRLALEADTPDKAIDIILEYIGKALKGQRTYIFEKNVMGGDDNTYEWTAEGVKGAKDSLQNIPSEICADWYDSFKENEVIIIGNVEDIKDSDKVKYRMLREQNINSLVVVPLLDSGNPIGFYGVDNPPTEFLSYSSDMLQIIAHFIVHSIKRRNMEQQLIDISYHDRLTGFGNRYAVDKFVFSNRFDNGLAVIYCDINGLKKVNDSFGHLAGDELILRACDCMKRVFKGYKLFRVGGDELVAMCDGITEQQMNELVEKLKSVLAECDVVMAIGTEWERGDDIKMDKLMGNAEQRMYKDKAQFYSTTGADRRKH